MFVHDSCACGVLDRLQLSQKCVSRLEPTHLFVALLL
jgi:hypothetical protein